MSKLRRRLSQKRPPIDLTTQEYGLFGPIVGTIHASKGREAQNVVLLLPTGAEFENAEEEAEETRVLFVGATRAKTSLMVGEGTVSRSASLSSGRAYGWTRNGKTMLEIGRDGDIAPRGLVGSNELSASEAAKAQNFLAGVSDVVTTYSLQVDPELDWRYRIVADSGETCAGAMERSVGYDLWDLLKKRNQGNSHRPPGRLSYVRGHGCSTMVLAPDDSEASTLHEPWASSGFLLTPRIAAYPSFYFKRRS
nr:ATP-binding domain-containing protein [Ruegeria lacuscaerulensis]